VSSFNVIIAGVGGQGVILTSRLIGLAAIKKGLHAVTAETIGMAQREGSVISHVRFGEKTYGPLIPKGEADLILGLEPAEAARQMPFLKQEGKMVVNTFPILPSSAFLEENGYDLKQILNFIAQKCPASFLFNAQEVAVRAGNYKTVNIAILGCAAALGFLPFASDYLWEVIASELPAKILASNKKAFELSHALGHNR